LAFERIAALICDVTGASCHLVSLSHKKGCLLTAQPLIVRIKKRKPINHFKKGHRIYCDNLENQNAAPAAKAAHFPKMREVEKVGLLL